MAYAEAHHGNNMLQLGNNKDNLSLSRNAADYVQLIIH
jgi:hypothetical protein